MTILKSIMPRFFSYILTNWHYSFQTLHPSCQFAYFEVVSVTQHSVTLLATMKMLLNDDK